MCITKFLWVLKVDQVGVWGTLIPNSQRFLFFRPGKVHMPFIHSIFDADKKRTRKKKTQIFHSFNRLSPRICKNEVLRGNKKIRYLCISQIPFSSKTLFLKGGNCILVTKTGEDGKH